MTFARSFRVALGVLAVVSVGGAAAAQDVAYNAMPGTNFAAFKTYKWVDIQGATKPDQIVDQQITTALDAALASKGLTKTTDDKADLLVGYEVAVQQQKEWNAYGTGVYGGFRYGGGMTTATESTINIGTLGVSIYMTRPPNSWCGAGRPARRSIPRRSRRSGKRTSTRPSPRC